MSAGEGKSHRDQHRVISARLTTPATKSVERYLIENRVAGAARNRDADHLARGIEVQKKSSAACRPRAPGFIRVTRRRSTR